MAKKIDDTRMSWTATLLALPSIGVFFFADMLGYGLAWQGAAPDFAKLTPAAIRLDASGRLLIIAAALLGFGIFYLIVLRFLADLRDEFGPKTRRWLLGWYTGGVLLGGLWVWFGWMQIPVQDQLGKGFLRDALAQFGAASGAAPGTLLDNFLLLWIGNRFALMLAAGIVVTGGVSALVDPIARLDVAETRAFLFHQRRRLRTYVNAAATLLVVGLLFQIAWMRWPLVLLDSGTAAMLVRQIDASVALTGVTGSVVIALFAVPASTILAARAAALPPVTDDEPNARLFDAGLLSSVSKILVVLAPTLAGLAPSVIDIIGRLPTT
ncbi:MAG: hypothetical protein EOP62_20475 [Sphingomonadales bacterium]|nr:MAG: hypothetical protein EOP62_20475 [Sphingomonadales bacterium]